MGLAGGLDGGWIVARTAAEIEAELAIVDGTIHRIVAGGVQEFQQAGGGGDRAQMIPLAELRKHRNELLTELGRARRGTRARFIQGRSI